MRYRKHPLSFPVQSIEKDKTSHVQNTIPGTHATGPTDVTVGGRPAKLVVLTIDPDIQCAPNQYWLFGKYSMYPDTLESVIRTWIIDVDGQLYEIDSNQATSSPSLGQEIQQIVDSITFE